MQCEKQTTKMSRLLLGVDVFHSHVRKYLLTPFNNPCIVMLIEATGSIRWFKTHLRAVASVLLPDYVLFALLFYLFSYCHVRECSLTLFTNPRIVMVIEATGSIMWLKNQLREWSPLSCCPIMFYFPFCFAFSLPSPSMTYTRYPSRLLAGTIAQ